jgi:hypothetical protein
MVVPVGVEAKGGKMGTKTTVTFECDFCSKTGDTPLSGLWYRASLLAADGNSCMGMDKVICPDCIGKLTGNNANPGPNCDKEKGT